MVNKQPIQLFNSGVSPFTLEYKEEPSNQRYLAEQLENALFEEVTRIISFGSLTERLYQWEITKQLVQKNANKIIDKDFLDEILNQYKYPEVTLNFLWVLLLTSPRRTPTMKDNASFIKCYIKRNMVGITYMKDLAISHLINKLISEACDVEEIQTPEPKCLMDRTEEADGGKKRGPGRQKATLFKDDNVKKDECERVKNFLTQNPCYNKEWDSSTENGVTDVALCFAKQWQERGYIEQNYSVSALVNLLVKDCGIKIVVQQKALEGKLRNWRTTRNVDAKVEKSVGAVFNDKKAPKKN